MPSDNITAAIDHSAKMLLLSLSTDPKTAQLAPITARESAKLASVSFSLQ
jgi:hypothetical protein